MAAVGIIGLGSIGRRHAHELAALGATVVALRRPDAPSAPELEFIESVSDPDAFWRHELDAVIVANPTALHLEALAQSLAMARCPVLVEKPLAVSTEQTGAVSAAERARVRVAYCLRFHPAIRAVTDVLSSGEIGNVIAGRIRFGSYLPAWHQDGNFRAGYAARRELGGGALRTLSHELDLVQHWLGPVQAVTGGVGAVSALELDVDDAAYLTCLTASGAMVAVELDFVTRGYDRHGQLIGVRGRIDYRLNGEDAWVRVSCDGGEDRELMVGGFRAMYPEQARDLLQWAGGGDSVACTYEQAEHVLSIIEAAEASKWTPVHD